MSTERVTCSVCRVRPTKGLYCRACASVVAWKAPRRKARQKRDGDELARRDLIRFRTTKLIAWGVLVRPTVCAQCLMSRVETDRRTWIDAHHTDYDSPMHVQWLCRRCHSDLHNLERAGAA